MGEQKDKPFIVKGENAFPALKHWLKERGCNTYSWSRRDIINVGYDTKPDSDWGKYTPCGYIIIKSDVLFDATCAAIEKAYGWKREASTIAPAERSTPAVPDASTPAPRPHG